MDWYTVSVHKVRSHLLQDKVRTESYRDLMLENKSTFKDTLVLDVACGLVYCLCSQSTISFVSG